MSLSAMKTVLSLAHFPTEVLSQITYNLDGFAISLLWFTGSARLRYIFSKGGAVSRFSLSRDPYDVSTPDYICWPSIISKFPSLEEFSINGFAIRSLNATMIQMLPPTLKYLHMDMKSLLSSDVLATHFTELNHVHVQSLGSISDAELNTLCSIPTLESLRCTISAGNIKTAISHLPRTMKSLTLNGYLNKIMGAIPFLPPTLTELSLGSLSDFSIGDLHLLPQTLVILKLRRSLSYIIHHASWPPHLTELDIISSGPLDISLSAIPNVNFLRLDSYDGLDISDMTSPLPSSITDLTLIGLSEETALKMSQFPWPPKLRSLSTSETTNSDVIFINRLPPTLKRLFSQSTFKAMLTDWMNLPKDLMMLKLPYCRDVDYNVVIPHLPRGITELQIGLTCVVLSESWKLLPPQLRSLSVYHDHFTDETLLILPQSLTILCLQSNNSITNAGIANLPKNLEFFTASLNKLITKDVLPLLPPSMRRIITKEIQQCFRR
jgi:hypothetical protein